MRSLSEQLILGDSVDLRDALVHMTGAHRGVVLVVDEQMRLEGVLSDGDVRRALLNDVNLATPVRKIMNLAPRSARSVDEAKTVLEANRALLAVPVVAPDGRLASIVVLDPSGDCQIVSISERKELTEAPPHTVAVIPARGGSKRIPKKNLARIGGKTLLRRAIETLQHSETVHAILVSTDDDEIVADAREAGVVVPWKRPSHLAGDDVCSVDVVVHAFQKFDEDHGCLPEIGLLIEPTAPLRSPEHIDRVVRALRGSRADSAMTVSPVPHNMNPEEQLRMVGGIVRPYIEGRTMDTRRLREEQDTLYIPNGLAYGFRVSMLLERNSLYGESTIGIDTGWASYLDIDTADDLALAQFMLGGKL